MGQHLQYIGDLESDGNSHIANTLKNVSTIRNQQDLLPINGSSDMAAAQIGGTVLYFTCGLDTHCSCNKQLSRFSEAKKWAWKQKPVSPIDENSILGGVIFSKTHCHLQRPATALISHRRNHNSCLDRRLLLVHTCSREKPSSRPATRFCFHSLSRTEYH